MRLTAAIGAIAAVWLVVLPWLAARPALRARIERERAAGIDPGAKFYTELDAMDGVMDRWRRIESGRPGLWWDPRRGGQP
ncbi:MAG: hypothetical protein WD069_17140 [Planctomycetales bacterium]